MELAQPQPSLPPEQAAAITLLLRNGWAVMPEQEAVKALALLSGIRPELQDLQEHLERAGCGMFRNVPLPAMTRDELLALVAMFAQREATRLEAPAVKALRRRG